MYNIHSVIIHNISLSIYPYQSNIIINKKMIRRGVVIKILIGITSDKNKKEIKKIFRVIFIVSFYNNIN